MINRLAIVILCVGALALALPGCVMLPGPISNALTAASLWHHAAAGRGTADLIVSAGLERDCVLLRPALGAWPCRRWPNQAAEE